MSLDYKFDHKYRPIVNEIAHFESNQPKLGHQGFPDSVIQGRASDIKDFVLSFEAQFKAKNDLPNNLRFNNNAMADIINIVLDLPTENLTTGDAIRLIRNR